MLKNFLCTILFQDNQVLVELFLYYYYSLINELYSDLLCKYPYKIFCLYARMSLADVLAILKRT
ncbi:uncharacterized protein TOL2_C24710 [Desulfobacula toluolica Tol2]|uniref:Uncharacterized protein n=1 Tax=Desulfobacula toluolica (strain DSM 7467 / Tol2) TaxID=651182 RepID=K0NPA4_DESTT|nr:uncharacterized protein TOL2_C24710 [Desulfobacula toluolica Tol2]